ncbi:hypothetical protein HPB50_016196 [Hyalomma asiaticum]|uniref:Uncharacterized protein n=1 Tax=Hyalomma asiaticum TaxID=266040 RepID=A0ACB7SP00_HYAAI|nr:hypothetical protein HPB50_016196 [Hyalomma asiaticum]
MMAISGIITNTGHGVIFRVSDSLAPGLAVNISGGPLSYQYRFHELHIHYGRSDDRGSEHTIAGKPFPAELQIFGYNSDLYANMSEAVELRRSEGLVGISILLQLGDLSQSELRVLTGQLHRITYRGQEAAMKHLSIKELLPETDHFMTYEGSLTMPGCHETVTWIVLNKPIYITKQQLYLLRKLMQGDELNAKAPLSDNFRPTLPVNQRLVRTNIDFKWKQGSNCPSMYKNMYYQGDDEADAPENGPIPGVPGYSPTSESLDEANVHHHFGCFSVRALCASIKSAAVSVRAVVHVLTAMLREAGETSGNDFCEIRVRTSTCKEKLNSNTASCVFGVERCAFADARNRTPESGNCATITTRNYSSSSGGGKVYLE